MSNVIWNENIRIIRFAFMFLCIIPPLALFIIPYLIITKNPPHIIKGPVTNKQSEVKFGGGGSNDIYYITVGTKKLVASAKIYRMLSIGDNISAACNKDVLYYYTKLN